jgi:hypothetical protein
MASGLEYASRMPPVVSARIIVINSRTRLRRKRRWSCAQWSNPSYSRLLSACRRLCDIPSNIESGWAKQHRVWLLNSLMLSSPVSTWPFYGGVFTSNRAKHIVEGIGYCKIPPNRWHAALYAQCWLRYSRCSQQVAMYLQECIQSSGNSYLIEFAMSS